MNPIGFIGPLPDQVLQFAVVNVAEIIGAERRLSIPPRYADDRSEQSGAHAEHRSRVEIAASATELKYQICIGRIVSVQYCNGTIELL